MLSTCFSMVTFGSTTTAQEHYVYCAGVQNTRLQAAAQIVNYVSRLHWPLTSSRMPLNLTQMHCHCQVLRQLLDHNVERERLDPMTTWMWKVSPHLAEDRKQRQDHGPRPRELHHLEGMFIVKYDTGMNLSDAVSRKRGDYNNVCGEDISQIGLESHDAVIECIRTSTSPRDISLPQRGDRRTFRRNEDRSQSGYENPGYTCIADDVYGGILEMVPTRGAQYAHPSWDSVLRAKPMDEYTRFKKEAAKSALRFIQKDLRHHIGRVDRGVWLRNSPIPTIRCDEGGWVKLDRSLSNELLWTHHEREIGYPLSRTSRTEYNREMQRRLQLLIDGNYINYKSDGKIRLQFLGIRLAPPG